MKSGHNLNGFIVDKDENQLEILTAKYPWCSVARLSLLQAYKKNKAPQFEEQARKTALFFNNTNWLNWQLNKYETDEVNIEEAVVPGPDINNDTVNGITEETNDITDNSDDKIQDEARGENIQNLIIENQESPDTKIENEVDAPAENKSIKTHENIPLVTGNEAPGPLIFEPLHTTDYFASQGIKLTDEPVSTDKLGTQLKSFTEWLKSMKKIHTEKSAPGDEVSDREIQQIAEHSNVNAEVVTEAMAEVLVRQHKYAKATEVYRKLSLINPSKSAYFAAKIASLPGDTDLKTP